MLTLHTILVPTDLSDASLRAFEVACMLARERGARLEVLHVAKSRDSSGELEKLRDKIYRVLKPDANVRVDWRLEVGEPAEVILRVAGEVHADLILMGACNRDSASLLGGVAEKVLLRCSCPVLTLSSGFAEEPSTPGPASQVEQKPVGAEPVTSP